MASLPWCFRVAHWHLSFRWLQTAYFPMFVDLESHAIKHYILCVYGLPKLHLLLSTCSLSTDCAWFDAACNDALFVRDAAVSL